MRSFSVASAVNSHVTAQIEIPPTPLASGLQPRTLVHVVCKKASSEPYSLVFEGEYVANSLRESTSSKGFVLQCVGITNYWDTVYQYFINKLSAASVGQTELASFVSGGPLGRAQNITSIQTQLPTQHFSNYVVQALIRDRLSLPQAMLSVLALMGNVSERTGDVQNPRINSQVERAFVNLRMLERVAVLPDAEVQKMLNLRNAEAVLSKMSGALSDFAALSTVLSSFLGVAYYEWVAMAAPSYTARNRSAPSQEAVGGLDFYKPIQLLGGSDATLRATTSSVAVGDLPDGAPASAVASRSFETSSVQRDVILKPRAYFLPAPTCNVLFPCQYDGFTGHRNFLQEPTRLRLRYPRMPGQSQTEESNAFDTRAAFAPPELEPAVRVEAVTATSNVIRRGDIKAPAPTKQYELLVSQSSGDIDERVTGVVPSFEELGFAEYAASPGVNTAASDNVVKNPENFNDTPVDLARSDLTKYLAHVAQYRLELKRAAQRSIQGISGPYNPELVAGMPGLLLAKSGIFAGEFTNVNHSSSAQGQAVTVATLGFVRQLSMVPAIVIGNKTEMQLVERALVELSRRSREDTTLRVLTSILLDEARNSNVLLSTQRAEALLNGFDPVDKFLTFPSWLNKLYWPSAIASGVYEPILGVGSTISVSGVASGISSPSGEDIANQVLAANVIFLKYVLAEDKVTYVADFSRRPIVTAKQALSDFLGLSADPSETVPKRSSVPIKEDLTKNLVFGQTASNKTSDDSPVTDAYSPFLKTQVEAVRRYVQFLVDSRGGIRG